jgi:hypothetical protein
LYSWTLLLGLSCISRNLLICHFPILNLCSRVIYHWWYWY